MIIHPDHDNWYYTDKYSALMAKSANAEEHGIIKHEQKDMDRERVEKCGK